MRIVLLAALCVLLSSSQSLANNWARSMFSNTSHDFGTVARAANTEFRFEFENRTKQTIHVRNVRTSCNCTSPSIVTETVQPGQIGVILAKFNTHSHTGSKQATVTVTFDRPQFAEVQLTVKGYIRSDIVFNPGEALFGNVQEGDSKSLTVDLDYAGRSDWKVVGLGCNDQFIQTGITELSRSGGRVKYRIDLTLKPDAPVGTLQSEVFVKTNDRSMTSVPLRMLANVQPTIAISPQLVALGDVKEGESVRQILVIRGQQPFRITEIYSDQFDISFDPIDEPKNLHTLPVTLTMKPGKGEIQGKIFVKTDLPGNTEVSVAASCKMTE